MHIERLHNLCPLLNKITFIHSQKSLPRFAAGIIRVMNVYKIKRPEQLGKVD
jgi:hypothetical protein